LPAQRLQLAARRLGAAFGGEHEQAERVAPALLHVGAERRQGREAERAFGVAGLRRVEQEPRPVLRQERAAIADDEALAELRHRIEVAALSGTRQRVDGVVVAAGEVVLGGLKNSRAHKLLSIKSAESLAQSPAGNKPSARSRAAAPQRGQRVADFVVAAQTAVKMPVRMRLGFGGQPGTATSTGITLPTAPALA
jgi:hypothetical protein